MSEKFAKIEDLKNKVRSICKGSNSLYVNSILKKMSTNLENTKIFCEFLIVQHNNQNVKFNTTLTYIKNLSFFSEYSQYKDFEKITKDDIIDFLNSARKNEQEDPTHKWIGTHKTRHGILSKFFRWFYNEYKNNEIDQKKWVTPLCMQGIKQFHRTEKSTYKPPDIWSDEDHALFLKYCPEKRDRCYHAMANDTSARPDELLNLKIKDIKFKVSSTNMQYAEINITKSKTKPRTLPLIFSLPYVKDWLDSHPMTNNPDAFLFVSLSDRNKNSGNSNNNRISGSSLYKQYVNTYQKKYYPALTDKNSNIPERDKSLIRNLLTKPWNPYIQRHSALTAKSQILKESTLRNYAGWANSSRMTDVYIHYLGNESSKSLLEVYGIEDNSKTGQSNILKSKACPICSEPNKPDSRFCFKCKTVLTFDAYQEALEKQEEKDRKMNEMENQIRILTESQKDIMKLLKHPDKLAKIL